MATNVYKVYAKSNTGKIIEGTPSADSAVDALDRLHKAATAAGHTIVKATVTLQDGASEFKIKDQRAPKDDAPATSPAPAATASGRKRGRQ